MNKTARISTILVTIFCVFPSHTMNNRPWQSWERHSAGGVAITAIIVAALVYPSLKKCCLKTIEAARAAVAKAEIALIEAMEAAEQARLTNAKQWIKNAEYDGFLNENFDIQTSKKIEAAACRYYRGYSVLEAEKAMNAHVYWLTKAYNIFQQARENMNDEATDNQYYQLQVRAAQLIQTALDKAGALRQLKRYSEEYANNNIAQTAAYRAQLEQQQAQQMASAVKQRLKMEQQLLQLEIERQRLNIERQRAQGY